MKGSYLLSKIVTHWSNFVKSVLFYVVETVMTMSPGFVEGCHLLDFQNDFELLSLFSNHINSGFRTNL